MFAFTVVPGSLALALALALSLAVIPCRRRRTAASVGRVPHLRRTCIERILEVASDRSSDGRAEGRRTRILDHGRADLSVSVRPGAEVSLPTLSLLPKLADAALHRSSGRSSSAQQGGNAVKGSFRALPAATVAKKERRRCRRRPLALVEAFRLEARAFGTLIWIKAGWKQDSHPKLMLTMSPSAEVAIFALVILKKLAKRSLHRRRRI
mmetsp:Transcript_22500/g.40152  ORF Transcript_22500/g.40152 Transcript_22500/m.40152 type:complete len:209 (-) Transcript_22500:41-667(-)